MLNLEDINLSFGKTHILKNINLCLHKGELLCLLGDNGAGKSTLFQGLCGLAPFSSGEYCLKKTQVNLARNSLLKMRKLGLECVFQDKNLCLKQEIYKNFFATRHITKLGFLIDKKAEIKVANSIVREQLGIKSGMDAKDLALNLSGGERQALALARALHFDNEILLLDEPTSALAQVEANKVLRFLKEDCQQKGVILVTHNLAQAYEVGTSFVFLKHGELSAKFGRKDFANVQTLYEKFFEFC